ncbi:MAG: sigma-70 family RNA polymerase sigma factor [Armatimonadetes bacterium]|nr:sigma-70 family RNA polymerase sigma factor [Armatimonadota bacterium]MDW8121572.1 sigma-70 family RNA polymerase sigma factor [Armatimonadota bacterium]
MDEERLLDRCRQGDGYAWHQLVRSYWGFCYRLAYHLLRSREDAEDAAQDALLQVYRSLSSFRGESSFRTWLYRIVINCCRAKMRRSSPLTQVANEEGNGEQELVEQPDLDRMEKADALNWALNQLSEELRTVFILREVEGLTYSEISQTLGIPIGTVESRLHRARKTLRDLLKRIF